MDESDPVGTILGWVDPEAGLDVVWAAIVLLFAAFRQRLEGWKLLVHYEG
jgi:hypothetical protein